MSQERWDVVLRFLDGPLSYQGDIVCRGPVVRMGAEPGPGGLKLDGYRGLDNRQAVITAYDGGSCAIAPVGPNQVRVAPYESVDWREVQPLHGPVYLNPGDAFHLGPPNRGVTATFVECRRLGVWEQQRILSDAAQATPGAAPSNVKELDARKGLPIWFIPAMLVTALATTVAIMVKLVTTYQREANTEYTLDEGKEYYRYVSKDTPLPKELADGLKQPFHDFVMVQNAKRADWPQLEKPENWDQVFYDQVVRAAKLYSNRAFYMRLEEIKDSYADVVQMLRDADLPEVFAAIPYQESRYRADIQSPVCAMGYWQLMPEVAFRENLEVKDCKLKGSSTLWSPTQPVPVRNVVRRAPYVERMGDRISCRIQGCAVDERKDLLASTRAAILLLREAWDDDTIAESGAAVQLTILSHNAGYDEARYDGNRPRRHNILPAYLRYLRDKNEERAPEFYGANITCDSLGEAYGPDWQKSCGGYLPNETQQYAYQVVAQHILAVCFYAHNYGVWKQFKDWTHYDVGDGYCTKLQIPDSAAVHKWEGQ